jgi:hypothetical protein
MEKMAVDPPKSIIEHRFQTTPMRLLLRAMVVSDWRKAEENSAGME